ncbi:hypothetical protein HMN09_01281000 [Mycena chlorophos]|uniref:DUF6534 domain-containing protein n=1 Tax=Mycena chlorophos TaxID=658473 RepID=A0A8H6S161_MYCCL|nr:hypothetical protein HMN09_01281000 [Mycena chlorophos]
MPAIATVDVRLTYGPLLLGAFFNILLYGVTCTQQLAYLQSPRRDPWPTRLLVWGIFFVLTANTVIEMLQMYSITILQYGAIPDELPIAFISQPLSVILVGFPTQCFFIWRIYALGKFMAVPIVIFLFAIVATSAGLWTAVLVPVVARFANIPRLYRTAQVWLIASAVTDISIATSMACILRRHKTGHRNTDNIVDKLIRMTVQTGVVTALCSILDVVCFLAPALQGHTVNFIFDIPLPKLYSICLLSTLNARDSLRNAINGGGIEVFSSSDFRLHHHGGGSGGRPNVELDFRPQVRVVRQVETCTDGQKVRMSTASENSGTLKSERRQSTVSRDDVITSPDPALREYATRRSIGIVV